MSTDLRSLRLASKEAAGSLEGMSPELVLVDPELAAAARAALPEPSDVTTRLRAKSRRATEAIVETAPEMLRLRVERPVAPRRNRNA